MTAEIITALLSRLCRKLRLTDPDEETLALLEDELADAELEILVHLNMDELEERFQGKAVELAAAYYRQDTAEGAGWVKSRSYNEGEVSESESYASPEEARREVQAILDSLKRYRRVTC